MHWSEIKNVLFPNLRDTSRQWRSLCMLPVFFAAGLFFETEKTQLRSLTTGEQSRTKIAFTRSNPVLLKLFDPKEFEIVSLDNGDPLKSINKGDLDMLVEVPPELETLTPGLPLNHTPQNTAKEDKDSPGGSLIAKDVKPSPTSPHSLQNNIPASQLTNHPGDVRTHDIVAPDSQSVPTITLHYDSGKTGADKAETAVRTRITTFREMLRNEWRISAGIRDRWSIHWQHPLASKSKDKDKPATLFSQAQAITMWTAFAISWFSGIFACGLMAEEQQKSTLILLLISPTSKSSIIAANFLFALCCAVFCLIVGLVLNANGLASLAPQSAIPGLSVFGFFLSSIPFVVLTTSIGVYASTYIRHRWQPGLIDGLLAGAASAFCSIIYLPSYSLPSWIYIVPLSGTAVTMLNSALGSFDVGGFLISAGGSAICSVLFLRAAVARLSSGVMLDGVATKAGA